MFITFEGIDGSGKTTQIKLLSDYLNKNHINHILTREPGGSHIGPKIRDILLNKESQLCPEQEVLLFYADRVGHLKEKIIPAIQNNQIVLCDRYYDSTLALQYYGSNVLQPFIYSILHDFFEIKDPDYTFLIDLDAEIGKNRIDLRNLKVESRIDDRDLEFHKRVCTGYRTLANVYSDRFIIINGNQSIEDIHNDIINQFNNLINKTVNKEKHD